VKFKVWTPRPRKFSTMVEASAHAQAYFQRTGIVVAITDA